MGAWGAGIKSNDDFLDVYDDFFARHDGSIDPVSLAEEIKGEYERQCPWDDGQVMNNVLFALAQCLWECGKRDQTIFNEVENIISNDLDLRFWSEENGGNNKLVSQRKKALLSFWQRLNTEPKTIRKPKRKTEKRPPSLHKGDVFAYRAEVGFRAAVVLDSVCPFTMNTFLFTVCDSVFDAVPDLNTVLEDKTSLSFWCEAKVIIPKKDRIPIAHLEITGDYNGRAGFVYDLHSVCYSYDYWDRQYFFGSEKAMKSMKRIKMGTYLVKDVVADPAVLPLRSLPSPFETK